MWSYQMYKKILVTVDMGQIEKGEKILRLAINLLDDGGKIVLLNVTDGLPGYLSIEVPSDFIDRNVADTRERLAVLAAQYPAEIEIVVRIGGPAPEILSVAEEHDADLIIVASHRPNIKNYVLGATADRVVRHAACSVLVDR
jgi:nucleotide-binding universal stress UspA family protein